MRVDSTSVGTGVSFLRVRCRRPGEASTTDVDWPISIQVNRNPVKITSFEISDPGPTRAALVRWTLRFDHPVGNLAASHFRLTGEAASGAMIQSPAKTDGTGRIWDVTVATGPRSGTLGLQFNNEVGLWSSLGAQLPRNGPDCVMDLTPPEVSCSAPSATTAGSLPITYRVTYSDFATTSLDPGDIVLHKTGSADAKVTVNGSGSAYTVTLSGITGRGTLSFSLRKGTAVDALGNMAPSATTKLNPVSVDSVPYDTLQAYLKASDTGEDDEFGGAVAIDGDIAVVGAPFQGEDSFGGGGSLASASTRSSKARLHSVPASPTRPTGEVYVFARSAGVWTLQATLKGNNTGDDDWFGRSVAVSGTTLVVGAPLEDGSVAGVNGDGSQNDLDDSGAAYVFEREADGHTWTQRAYLKASNPGADDRFGAAVAISGDTVVVGAEQESGDATGVDVPDNNGAYRSGAAYVFARHSVDRTWSQQAYLKASNAGAQDRFGVSVGVSGDTAIVGARLESGGGTGVTGDPADNSAEFSGAAYIFARSGTTWSQQAYLKAPNSGAGDQFGYSVAISGDTAVVGGWLEDGSGTGIDPASNESEENAGAAYVFVRNAGSWLPEATLKASNTGPIFGGWPGAGQNFGYSVAISGDNIVVGAIGEQGRGVGVNPSASPGTPIFFSGAAYWFTRSGSTWSQHALLKSSNNEESRGDLFGASVAVSGDTVLVGASAEDGSGTGVNPGDDNGSSNSGAAYLYHRVRPPVNLPPVGVDEVLVGEDGGIYQGRRTTVVRLAAMLSNDYDPDGDAIQGGAPAASVVPDGSKVKMPPLGTSGLVYIYTPEAFTGPFTFTYSIYDTPGGHRSEARCTVFLPVAAVPPKGNTPSIQLIDPSSPGAGVRITWVGKPSSSYTVRHAHSPTGPWVDFNPVALRTTTSLGQGSFVDGSSSSDSRFYRVFLNQ